MKKLRPVIVILGTLLIGFIIGFVVSGYIHDHQLKNFMQCAGKDGLVKMIYQKTNATEEQRQLLDPILQKYSEKSSECLEKHKIVIDSMRKEIEEHLTPEQRRKLEECIGCKGKSCNRD